MKSFLAVLLLAGGLFCPCVQAQQSNAVRDFQIAKAAAEKGDASAQCDLGSCYGNGLGVTKDDAQAAKWYRKAAEQGNAWGEFQLGWCYRDGKGVAKDNAEAVMWWRASAEHGNVDAQTLLSSLPKSALLGAIGVDLVRESGGVLKVPVQVNGAITLKFVVDSGASEVQIPKDVVLTLIRTETIKESDFLPGKTFILANGSTVKSDRFILRSIKLGESTYSNVEASVGGLNSILLLGQSFLSRFSEWKIDNKNGKLILTK